MEVFIARRYSEYTLEIEPIIKDICPLYTIHLTDSKLRSSEISKRTLASLSVIIISEFTSDREEPGAWLARLTQQIRKNSQRVYVLLFSQSPEKYVASYNKICPFMTVDCVLETFEDENNIVQIKENLCEYLCKFRNSGYI